MPSESEGLVCERLTPERLSAQRNGSSCNADHLAFDSISVRYHRVADNIAIALGDPVEPEEEIGQIVRSFLEMCRENGWAAGFYQTLLISCPLITVCDQRRVLSDH